MYCNPYEVRELSSQLSINLVNQVGLPNLTEDKILKRILAADSFIHSYLKPRYVAPITKKEGSFNSGTISTTKVTNPDSAEIESPYNTVIGVGTSFLSELHYGDMIQVVSTLEALRVVEIVSDTELRVSSNANFTASGSKFFIIPEEIRDASLYKSAQLCLLSKNEDTSYGQDNIPFFTKLEKEVKPFIESLSEGRFFDDTLLERPTAQNTGRFFKVSSANKALNDSFIDKMNSFL